MKFFLYFIIIIISTAILKRILGTDPAKDMTKGGHGRLLPQTPDLKMFQAWLLDQACQQCGEGVRNDPLATTRLNETAEKALHDIKEGRKSEINLPFLIADASGPKHFNISIDPADARSIL